MPDASAGAGRSQEWTGLTRGPKFSKGPKFYKGASHETAWNKDMLWQLYVRREAKSMGFKCIGSCDNASSGNPDLPPHMRKATLIDDTGSVVYKLGLSPRPKPLQGLAARQQKQALAQLHPRQGPEAEPPPWVPVDEPKATPGRDVLDNLVGARAKAADAESDYSNMSVALSRAVIEHRLKTAQEREERLELILQKQRGRREQVQRVLQAMADKPEVSPVSPRRDLTESEGATARQRLEPGVKSASHLQRRPLPAFKMA